MQTVLLAEAKLPAAEDVANRVNVNGLRVPQLSKAELKGDQLTLEFGEQNFVVIGLMPTPVPGIEQSCKLVWH